MARRALATAVGLRFVLPAAGASAAALADWDTLSPGPPDFTATGDFPAARQGSFVFVPFDVPAGVTQVRICATCSGTRTWRPSALC